LDARQAPPTSDEAEADLDGAPLAAYCAHVPSVVLAARALSHTDTHLSTHPHTHKQTPNPAAAPAAPAAAAPERLDAAELLRRAEEEARIDEVLALDARGLRRLAAQLERKARDNMELRMKHAGEPMKFLENEIDLLSLVREVGQVRLAEGARAFWGCWFGQGGWGWEGEGLGRGMWVR